MSTSVYPLGTLPPLGQVPPQMHACVIRPDRYGEPLKAMRTEVVDVPAVGRGKVLVAVMAAGINYNNVWSSLGHPVDVIAARRKRGDAEDYHIGGSEGSGVVWAVGDGVRTVRVGDRIVIGGAQWDEQAEDIRLGADPMTSRSNRAWGYEENFGSFAQFAVIDEYQCHPKPPNLTWEEAASFVLTAATAYRQLFGWPPHVVRPGDVVLVWGGAGGLGSMAIQLTRMYGGVPVAVVSSEERGQECLRLGARGYLNRTDFDHWGRMPDIDDQKAFKTWASSAQRFGRGIWEIVGERRNPRLVLEHSGEDSLPTSMYVCDAAGMVVLCGGTSGYNGDVDLRVLWMRQKRLQGSHGANGQQYREVVNLVAGGHLNPCLSLVHEFDEIGHAHQLLYENRHPVGNMAALVSAPNKGMTDLPADLQVSRA